MQDSPPQRQSSGLSFTQGLLLGQLSVVVLIFFFIKFFIFGEIPEAPPRRTRSFSTPRRPAAEDAASSKKLSSVLRSTQPLTSASILSKTYYNVNGHQPESVDWFNVLIAQTIAQLRNDAQQDNAILKSLTHILNGPGKPDYLDEVRVTEINLGEEFPIFSNCRVIPVEGDSAFNETKPSGSRPSSSAGKIGDGGRLQARMDVDLSDAITLGIETKLVLNYPRPFVAVMPVALAISVVRFSGTLSISFIPSRATPSTSPDHSADTTKSANSTTPTSLTFSFLPDYRLELSTRSLLGSRSRLQDVPKIAQLVESQLHSWFDERCVEPRFQQIVLPSLWPRRKNTRGGDSDESSVENVVVTTKAVHARTDAEKQPDGAGALRLRRIVSDDVLGMATRRADKNPPPAEAPGRDPNVDYMYRTLPGSLPIDTSEIDRQ